MILKNFIEKEKFYLKEFNYKIKKTNQNPFRYDYRDFFAQKVLI